MVFHMCKFREWEWERPAGMGGIGNTENIPAHLQWQVVMNGDNGRAGHSSEKSLRFVQLFIENPSESCGASPAI